MNRRRIWPYTLRSSVLACLFLPILHTQVWAQDRTQYRQLAELSSPGQLVTDADNLYWSDNGFLWRLKKQTGNVQRVGDGIRCCRIAYDSGYVYWISLGDIGRVSTANGDADIIISGLRDSRYLAVTPTYVAWITDGYGKPEGAVVQILALDRGGTVKTLASNQKTSNIGGIVADGDVLYWVEFLTGNIMRMGISDKQPTVLCERCAGDELIQDKDFLYVISEGSINRITKRGGISVTLYRSPRQPYMGVGSISMDPHYVYFTSWSKRNQATGIIGRVSKMGGRAQIVMKGLNAPKYLIVDSQTVYFVDYNPGSIGGFVGAFNKPQ